MARMTIAKLHKELGKMIEAGHKRTPVTVDKQSFRHPLEGDFDSMILAVEGVQVQWVTQADEHGGTKVNKDGSEAGRFCIVLDGGCG